jgi:anti-anti-sigma regulatory factor
MRHQFWIALGTALLGAGTLYVLLAFPTMDQIDCLRSGPWNTLKTVTSIGRLGVWLPYMVMPVALITIWVSVRPLVPAGLLVRYGAFILSCGLTHLLGFVMFFWPVYWLAAKLEVVTAAISLAVMVETIARKKQIIQLVGSGAALIRETERAKAAEARAEARATEAEASLAREQELRDALMAAGATMSRLGRGILMMTVIGPVDTDRGRSLMEMAAEAAWSEQAKAMILDVSGVQEMDTGAVQALGHVAGAVTTLGTRVFVAGIRPQIAITMRRMGVEFDRRTTTITRDAADALAALTGHDGGQR